MFLYTMHIAQHNGEWALTAFICIFWLKHKSQSFIIGINESCAKIIFSINKCLNATTTQHTHYAQIVHRFFK